MHSDRMTYAAGLSIKKANAVTVLCNIIVLPLLVFSIILLLMPLLAPYVNSDLGGGRLSLPSVITGAAYNVLTVSLVVSVFYVVRKAFQSSYERTWVEHYNHWNDPINNIVDLHKKEEFTRDVAKRRIEDVISGWNAEQTIVGLFSPENKNVTYYKVFLFLAISALIIVCTAIVMCDYQMRAPGKLGTNSVYQLLNSFLWSMQAGIPIMLLMHRISGWTEIVLPNELPPPEVERISEMMLEKHKRDEMTTGDVGRIMFELKSRVERNNEKFLQAYFQAPMWKIN